MPTSPAEDRHTKVRHVYANAVDICRLAHTVLMYWDIRNNATNKHAQSDANVSASVGM